MRYAMPARRSRFPAGSEPAQPGDLRIKTSVIVGGLIRYRRLSANSSLSRPFLPLLHSRRWRGQRGR